MQLNTPSLSPSCVNEGIFDSTANDFNMSEGRYYVAQCKHIFSAKTQAASENILRLVWQTPLSVRNTPSLSENTQLPMRAKLIFNTKIVFQNKRRANETADKNYIC